MITPAAMAGGTDSGIEGTISVSPSRPGPQRIGETGRAPAGQVAFVVHKGEEQVAAFTTDAEGHFHVALPPGHYSVGRNDAGAAIGRWHFDTDVVTGKVTKVDWTADSGMR